MTHEITKFLDSKSSNILKKDCFGNWICFHLQVKGMCGTCFVGSIRKRETQFEVGAFHPSLGM
jgi:hypothetical protein